MPTAGEEGYEHYVTCPYDKAHQVRRGRMQFHLDKCRKGHPEKSKDFVQCPYNSTHCIARCEESYHIQEECVSRANFDRHTHQIGDVSCPVKDLVPVNSYTSSVDADENWDDFEAQGSVLNTIKQSAAEKPILRMMQCESKAKRKNFKLEQRRRYNELMNNSEQSSTSLPPASPVEEPPLRRPTAVPRIPLRRQDSEIAAATISASLKSMDLETASSLSARPQPKPMSPTSTASSPFSHQNDPSMFMSYPVNSGSHSESSFSPVFHHASEPRPTFSYASASAQRPDSSLSSLPTISRRPNSAFPSNCNSNSSTGDGFCQVPIPGLGRGSRRGQK